LAEKPVQKEKSKKKHDKKDKKEKPAEIEQPKSDKTNLLIEVEDQ
jgi:hypothetical protein